MDTKDEELLTLIKRSPDDELIFLTVFLYDKRGILERYNKSDFIHFMKSNAINNIRNDILDDIASYRPRDNISFFNEIKFIYKSKIRSYKDYIKKVKPNEIILYNCIRKEYSYNANDDEKQIFWLFLALDVINNFEINIRNDLIKMDRQKNLVKSDLKTYINDDSFIEWLSEIIVKDKNKSIIDIAKDIMSPLPSQIFKMRYFISDDKYSLIIFLSIKELDNRIEYKFFIANTKKAWQQKNYLANKNKNKSTHIKLSKKTIANLEQLSTLNGKKKEAVLTEIIEIELQKAKEENEKKA